MVTHSEAFHENVAKFEAAFEEYTMFSVEELRHDPSHLLPFFLTARN